MAFTNVLENVKTYLFKTYSGDTSKMLLHTGTFAWITSAAAQIFGIVNNDKVSKEQKKFLIPQEMADAAINILSFYFVTKSIQNTTKKLASSGKIITKDIREFCVDNKIQHTKIKGGDKTDIGKAILKKIDDIKATIKINEENAIGTESDVKKLQGNLKELNTFYDEKYASFESGVKIVGSVTGAVLSSNIITPILRNPIAAMKQKSSMAKDKGQNEVILPAPIILPAQNRFGIDDYKSKVMAAPRVITGGSMRV